MDSIKNAVLVILFFVVVVSVSLNIYFVWPRVKHNNVMVMLNNAPSNIEKGDSNGPPANIVIDRIDCVPGNIGNGTTKIYNGQFVLLYSNGNFGAFVPVKQTGPERQAGPGNEVITYSWFYNANGSSVFNLKDASLQKGTTTGTKINFGSFYLDWSIHQSNRSGWLYYDFNGGGDTYVCVTDKSAIESIDAADHEFTYFNMEGNAGISGDKLSSLPRPPAVDEAAFDGAEKVD